MPAAIVVEDAGTTLANGERLDSGPTVARDLVASRSFDWHQVDRAEATSGVASGRYDFALIVPREFSGDLASNTGLTPRQAHLQVATNDANNYIAHTIAGQVVAQVTKSVPQQVSATAANQLLLGFSTIDSNLTQGVGGGGQDPPDRGEGAARGCDGCFGGRNDPGERKRRHGSRAGDPGRQDRRPAGCHAGARRGRRAGLGG